jgi:hypothetical protein
LPEIGPFTGIEVFSHDVDRHRVLVTKLVDPFPQSYIFRLMCFNLLR